ncbi:TPA: DUF2177 domain-containing protein [Candidatus Saccharibacteria bacterium]|nr:MAG: putative transmembrane protein [Candidatus Saccharibacteria bacterium GW2011_GWC2_44_17]OGL34071.1 MAG: hypothetical protein A3E20_04185 [Candidatus Saccharibacteria bacterium RIFCSPHIGHO2_12_FULL_47_16]HBH78124.1 DUF2177 domain-containing protein [Candidatus Saccharibacteria bacterium]
MNFIITFVTFGIIFALIDAVWLKTSNALYKKELGSLIREKPDFVAAIIFYVIYVTGVSLFTITPVLDRSGSWLDVLLLAGMFGLVAYATYDLTNQATLKGWSKKIVVIDLVWGMAATAVSATVSYLLITNVFGV